MAAGTTGEGPPPPEEGSDPPGLRAANARHGLRLFAVYLLLYGGFMGMSAFFPRASGWAPFGGVNLAILYGLALIAAAVLLAFLYVFLCAREGRR